MELALLDAYFCEIERQCRFALTAFEKLKENLEDYNNLLSEINHLTKQYQTIDLNTRKLMNFFADEVFREIHSFMIHAANVSKFFWPKPLKKERLPYELKGKIKEIVEIRNKRTQNLRKLYSLPDKAKDHILGEYALRNHLEHFDERFFIWEIYYRNQTERSYFDVIRPFDDLKDTKNSMRVLDPETLRFMFQGEVYDLRRLALAISEINWFGDEFLGRSK